MKKIAIILLLLPYMTAFADINSELLSAACHGHIVVVERLIKKQDVNVNTANHFGETALSHAVRNNDIKCLQLLLQWGADPDIADCFGMIPLMHSASPERISILKILAPITKKINALNIYNHTALYYAVLNNNIEAIKILIACGADPHAGDTNAQALTSCAKYAHLREVIETSQQAALKTVLGTHLVQFVRNREIGRAQLSHKKPATSASKPVHHMPAAASSAEPASGAMAPWPCNRPRA